MTTYENYEASVTEGSSRSDPPPQTQPFGIRTPADREPPPERRLTYLQAQPLFTFEVTVSQKFVGEVPGGFRVDLHFDAKDSNQEPKVLSGNDWVAVSDEGVIDFDSRFTLQFGEGDVKVPVSARLRGRASVVDTMRNDGQRRFKLDESVSVVRNAWKQGFEDAYLPLRLTVVFDIPREGFSREETEVYADLRSVYGRDLFVGYGKARFDGSPYGSVDSIQLELFRLTGERGDGS